MMFGMTAGYTFLVLIAVLLVVAHVAEVGLNAWRARGVAVQKTKQAEIEARVREAEANARIVSNYPLPVDPPSKKKRG